jgi:hypothetical protein
MEILLQWSLLLQTRKLHVNVVREKIIAESGKMNPVAQFDSALAAGDIGQLMTLLNGAWFGVPESTECWGIEGFKIAVDLMDDPPEEE